MTVTQPLAETCDTSIEYPEPAPLRLLIESLMLEGVTREHFLKRAENASKSDIVDIVDDLGLIKTMEDRNMAVTRGRTILRSAYPNYPIQSYSKEYIELMLLVLPTLFINKVKLSPNSKPEVHLDNLDNWLNGMSPKEICVARDLSSHYIYHWKDYVFPIALRKNVTFFDISRATDYLYDVEELIGIN